MESTRPRSTLIITGPTATGKTTLAVKLARKAGRIEIINADSMLVYRGMNIGTAKPTPAEMGGIPHHLIDVREPCDEYAAGDFRRDALATIAEIESRGNRALIVGGTGFYLKALLYGLWDAPKADAALRSRLDAKNSSELHRELAEQDPASAVRIGQNDRYRLIRALELVVLTGKTPSELETSMPKTPDPRFELFVIDRAQEELYARIAERTKIMLEAGFIDEVRALSERFSSVRPLAAVGYSQVRSFLEGRSPEGRTVASGIAGLEAEITLATRQLVKKQRTWFRSQQNARWFVLEGDFERLKAEFIKIYGGPIP